jgi:Raf kinase inhibitor-like YbhB/YbcL family protein
LIARLLGQLLKNRHAGEEKLLWNHPSVSGVPASITLSSPSFLPNGTIPVRYAGDGVGQNISPALSWTNIPNATAELVLVMEDPDAPLHKPFLHLIAAHIPAALRGVGEGALNNNLPGVLFGPGGFGKVGYSGPRALPAHGPHRYVFQIFAVSQRLSFSATLTIKMLLDALEGKIIARGRLIGIFERK